MYSIPIDRVGQYTLDVNQPLPLDESIFSSAWLPHKDLCPVVAKSPHDADHEPVVGRPQWSLEGQRPLTQTPGTHLEARQSHQLTPSVAGDPTHCSQPHTYEWLGRE